VTNAPRPRTSSAFGLGCALGRAISDGLSGLQVRVAEARRERDIARMKAHLAWYPTGDKPRSETLARRR